MNSEKRTRAANFSVVDSELLRALVAEFKDVLQNPKTDAVSVSSKKKAWEKITKRFNANTLGECRSIKVLRERHRNMKQSLRRLRLQESLSCSETGDNGSLGNVEDTTESDLLELSKMQNEIDIKPQKLNDHIDSAEESGTENPIVDKEESDIEDALSDHSEKIMSLASARKRKLKKITKVEDLDYAIKKAQLKLIKKKIKLCKNQIKLSGLQLEGVIRNLL